MLMCNGNFRPNMNMNCLSYQNHLISKSEKLVLEKLHFDGIRRVGIQHE